MNQILNDFKINLDHIKPHGALYNLSAKNYDLGQTYDTLPISAEAVTINDQQYFKYQDIYFLPQINGDEIKYLAINLG